MREAIPRIGAEGRFGEKIYVSAIWRTIERDRMAAKCRVADEELARILNPAASQTKPPGKPRETPAASVPLVSGPITTEAP